MKKLAVILAILLLATAFTGCQGGTGSSGKTLTMATEATFPPYEYMDGAEIVGIDVDIAREIANEMGATLVIENMNFDAVIPAVNSGKADFGAAGMSITEDRLKEVDFSIEYATSMQVIVTKADSGITGEADLAGKTVGVQMGTVADIVLTEDYPDVKVERMKKYTDVAADLATGRLDAAVLDSLPAAEMVKNGENLIICDQELFTDVYAICVKKGNTEMLETINTVLRRLMDEGKIIEYTANHTA